MCSHAGTTNRVPSNQLPNTDTSTNGTSSNRGIQLAVAYIEYPVGAWLIALSYNVVYKLSSKMCTDQTRAILHSGGEGSWGLYFAK